MTDMEKKVMVRLCAKILSETDLYDMDTEVRNLIDWICVSEQIKSNNNEIRSLLWYTKVVTFRSDKIE